MSTDNKDALPPEAKSISSDDIEVNHPQFGPTLNRNSDGDRNDEGGRARSNFEENSDAGYADPQTDKDWRTSNTGFSSVGASDLNADESQEVTQSSEDVPGVRRDTGR